VGFEMKPEILLPGFTVEELNKFKSNKQVWRTADIYAGQLEELHSITYPAKNGPKLEEFVAKKGGGDLAGAWVYYPWSGVLLHCVGPDDLFSLRTNRNQNLISREEQHKLNETTVAVAGMSVGSGIALACAYSGMSKTIKIADFDQLETANLNRLRESLTDIGESKANLAARRIYELNPFADVKRYEALDDSNIDDFFVEPKLGVVVDEIDDFKMKVQLRLKAKEHGVPLLMFTSLGDNILIDIERYDLDDSLVIFNGAIGDEAEEILRSPEISAENMKRYAVTLVGPQYVPTKAMASLPDIGKSLVGRPQLYSTIAVDGGLAAFLIRRLTLGDPVKSGRFFVKFAELVGLRDDDLSETEERREILAKLMGK
jgi:hypothetical protein